MIGIIRVEWLGVLHVQNYTKDLFFINYIIYIYYFKINIM